ncbi:MAG: hypothetical protein RLZ28_812 [Actinomycetota bacterium]
MSSVTLAIDTSSGTSVAILRGDEVLAEVSFANAMQHVETVGTSLADALAAAGISARQVNAVVVGRGPAPFTGLRVGIAAGTVFAQAIDAKLLGAVSLDALAWSALENPDLASRVSATAPLLITSDARRSEVYWALYTGLSNHGFPIRVDLPAVAKPAALQEHLIDRNVVPVRPVIHDGFNIATALARVALAQIAAGETLADTSPLYLRAPDAVLPKPHARFGKVEYSKPVIGEGAEPSGTKTAGGAK